MKKCDKYGQPEVTRNQLDKEQKMTTYAGTQKPQNIGGGSAATPPPTGQEIPFWIFGQQKWVSGINKNTTCQEVLTILFKNLPTGSNEESVPGNLPADPSLFSLVEKWRKIERPLSPSSKVLRVWHAWGEDKSEVKLVVKRSQSLEVANGSPDVSGQRVRRKRSKMLREGKKPDTYHPKSLYEDKEKCKDSIQKLMRIIIAQGSTIQNQLHGLQEKEEAIDSYEQRMHHLRMKESGRDYLLHTYLDQLPVEGPHHYNNTKGENATLALSSKSDRKRIIDGGQIQNGLSSSPPIYPCGIPPEDVAIWADCLDKLNHLNIQLTRREEEMVKLNQRTRRHCERQKRNRASTPVPELEEILPMSLAALEKELCLSRHEVETLIEAINATMDESKKIERDLIAIEERKVAGDIYIRNLMTDLKTAENEGEELQKEFDWILTLPPSAFASKEMLEWLKRDLSDSSGDTDSELGLDLSCQDPGSFSAQSRNVLLPDQIHPSPGSTASDPARSSSTGSTSSGFSSDLQSLVSPEPERNLKSKGTHQQSSKGPPLPPKRIQSLILPNSDTMKFPHDHDDCNSDTGLSSLNSSAEDPYSLDTLV